MNLMCALGLHNWNGCKCTSCLKVRDAEHDWTKDCERCSTCGARRQGAHDWSKDCECCATCGITRPDSHSWKGCKCTQCGKIRDEAHNWQLDCLTCSICGKHNYGTLSGHDWNGCRCNKCVKTRDEGHDWDGCKCRICGKTAHDWRDGTTCSKCGEKHRSSEWSDIDMTRMENRAPNICGKCNQWLDVIIQLKYAYCPICNKKYCESCLEYPRGFGSGPLTEGVMEAWRDNREELLRLRCFRCPSDHILKTPSWYRG